MLLILKHCFFFDIQSEYVSDFPAPWEGHKPNRNSYLFSGPASGGGVRFQKEWNGDSIYAGGNKGGIGGGFYYRFYGKKL